MKGIRNSVQHDIFVNSDEQNWQIFQDLPELYTSNKCGNKDLKINLAKCFVCEK